MTLNSGADVKIGQYEFFLDSSVDEPYAHVLESLYSDTSKIEGSDDETANPNVKLWFYDDFAGGAENKYYSGTIPDSWWYGNNNPRIRGAIQSPPDTAAGTGTLSATSPTQWHTTSVGGFLWVGVGRDVFYTNTGTSLTQHGGTGLFAAGYVIDGMTHDGTNPWVTASNGTTRKTVKLTSTSASTAAINDRSTSDQCFGMAMLEGQIYQWTGAKLYKYDSTETLPITHSETTHKVHDPFGAPSQYGGIAASESSIFYYSASDGDTYVFEYRFSSATGTFLPRPVWRPSPGFTARKISCSMGVLYLLGDYVDQVALFGMSQVNREPLFLSFVGQQYGANGVALTPSALSPSYGTQMLVGMRSSSTNYYFIYDAEIDSMSQLDEQATSADGLNYAMATFRNKRVALGNNSDTTARIRSWNQDFDTPTRAWTWVSSAWNFGYPMDEKLLFGFQVVQDPTIATGTVQVEYQIDEDGVWRNAGTTGAGVKYTNLDISASNMKFRNLRVRMTGANGARVFSITARSYINSYQELWRLVVKMRDEKAGSRPAARAVKAEKLRGYLNSLATSKSVVTFLDGRNSPVKGRFTTHSVVVEFPRYGGIRIKRSGGASRGHFEGGAEITLRSTLP